MDFIRAFELEERAKKKEIGPLGSCTIKVGGVTSWTVTTKTACDAAAAKFGVLPDWVLNRKCPVD